MSQPPMDDAQPSTASTPKIPDPGRHDRRYVICLLVFIFFTCASIISMLSRSRATSTPEDVRWIFQMTAGFEALFVGATVTTLILRGVAPGAGRIATKALNLVMLLVFPFGTALGITG